MTMRLRLMHKLLFAFLLTSVLLVGVSALALQLGFSRHFLEYLSELELQRVEPLARALEAHYARHRGWDELRDSRSRWADFLRTIPRPEGRPGPRPNGRGELQLVPSFTPPPNWPDRLPGRPPGRPGLGPMGDGGPPPDMSGSLPTGSRFPPPPPDPFLHRLRLVDAAQQRVVGDLPEHAEFVSRPLRAGGVEIGALQLGVPPGLTDALDIEFQRRQMRMVLFSALLGLGIALIAALPLARHLTGPLRTLTAGLRRLTAGHYDERARIQRADEFGELATGFNQLAETLERNEVLRRRWIADVSHELRTPLTVLSGELDALADGVRTCTPEAVGSLQSEVRNINKLVDDLYQLALSDLGALSYRREPLELEPLLQNTLHRRAGELQAAGLQLQTVLASPSSRIDGDPVRLTQLFDNLLENTLRYTDRGGRLEVRSERVGGEVRIDFCDSAPGVPDAALPHLFERLYRVDKSRSRARGGAGLGLAICANIVNAHGGRATAGHSALGGLAVGLALPLADHRRGSAS